MCYNEELILRQTIEHYLNFCSRVFVIDNSSTDSSPLIASEYQGVEIINYYTNDGFNDFKNVWAKEKFFKQYSLSSGAKFCGDEADFIITVDADEFLIADDILSILKKCNDEYITVPKVAGFNMVSLDWTPEHKLTEHVVNGTRAPAFDKPILFSSSFEPQFSPGCHPHGAKFERMLHQKNFKTTHKVHFFLLHFKHVGLRGHQKGVENFKRLSPTNINKGFGSHYSKLKDNDFALLVRNNLMEKSKPILDSNGRILFLSLENNCWSC